MDHVKRIWYLSPMWAAKAQASLCIRAVSPEPPLLAHACSESRGTFRQKARSLALLNGWACAVKICHDGMLKDTNSLDGAHMVPETRLSLVCQSSCNQQIWRLRYNNTIKIKDDNYMPKWVSSSNTGTVIWSKLNAIKPKWGKFCHNMSRLITKQSKWLCAQRRLRSAWASAQSDQSSLCRCPGWSESSLGAQSFCWFCHEAAHMLMDSRRIHFNYQPAF